MKTKENSQLVLNTTTGLPPSSTFFIFLLFICRHYTSPCNFQMQNLSWWSRDTGVKHCVFLFHLCLLFLILSFEFLSLIFCLLGQEDEWRVRGEWILGSPHQAYPCKLAEGNRMVCGGVDGGILVGVVEV